MRIHSTLKSETKNLPVNSTSFLERSKDSSSYITQSDFDRFSQKRDIIAGLLDKAVKEIGGMNLEISRRQLGKFSRELKSLFVRTTEKALANEKEVSEHLGHFKGEYLTFKEFNSGYMDDCLDAIADYSNAALKDLVDLRSKNNSLHSDVLKKLDENIANLRNVVVGVDTLRRDIYGTLLYRPAFFETVENDLKEAEKENALLAVSYLNRTRALYYNLAYKVLKFNDVQYNQRLDELANKYPMFSFALQRARADM